MKLKDDILLEYIKHLFDNTYEPSEYKVIFKEAQNPSGDYSINFYYLTEVFYFLKSNLVINLLKMSNIFDSIEIWEINNSQEYKVSKVVWDKEILDENLNAIEDNNKKRMLFKFNVREIY